MISIYFLLYITISIFYIFFGIYVIHKDNHSTISKKLFIISFLLSFWATGYGCMFIAPNIYLANFWRLLAAFGWCFFFCIWLELSLIIKDKEPLRNKIRVFLYLPPLFFFINNLSYKPETLLYRFNNLWNVRYPVSLVQILFDVYYIITFSSASWIFYQFGKNSILKREKKQAKIIIFTSVFSCGVGFITDTLFPILNVKVLPLGIVVVPIGLVGMWYAISKYKMIKISFTPKYLSENISEYIFKIVNDPIFVIEQDCIIKKVNDIALEMLDSNILGKNFNSLISGPKDLFKNLLQNGCIKNVEISLVKKNNELLEFELSGKVIYDEFNDIYGILIILHDISERKKIEKQLKAYNDHLEVKINEKITELEKEIFNRTSAENKILYIGYHDELTGLPNRRYFNESITELINSIRDENEYFIVMFLDLDNFKLVNDMHGHHNGDRLLRHYADNLKSIIRKNDLLARIGGDEFLILIRNLYKNEEVNIIELLSKKILDVFNEPFVIEDKENFLTASIGIAQFPIDGRDAGTLIMNADIAMYEAKNTGKNNIKICTEEIKNKIVSKTILRNRLYKALSSKELSVYYQPQVNLNLNKIAGFEALLRWKIDNGEFVPPTKFIPLAEETGLIVPIGYWVIETACQTLRKWSGLAPGNQNLSMAINLSINQLNEAEFVHKVAHIIDESRINPSQLEFEVTERIILKGNEAAEGNLVELKKLGVKISIDDFGMEYSSFINIKKLTIDKIKIAMEFIQGLNKNKRDNIIVNSIIALSHDLNLSVIAEGVETREQIDFLRYLKCDAVQGYFYYKPLPDIEIESILIQEDYKTKSSAY